MVIYVKSSISYSTPIFIFLDLIELKNQTASIASNIVDQLLECLHCSGFTEEFLVRNWVPYVTDGASVLLGEKEWSCQTLKGNISPNFQLALHKS